MSRRKRQDKESKESKTAEHEDSEDEAVPSNSEMWKVLIDIQRNTAKILEDNEEQRKMCSDLKDAMDFTSGRVDELENQKKSLTDKMAELEKKHMETLDIFSKSETASGSQVEKDLDDLQQYTRKYNLEIAGIPKYQHISDEKIVLQIAEALDVELDSKDIDIVHRINIKNLEMKPIIVRFGSYKAKQRMYKARKNLKGVDWSAIYGAGTALSIYE